MNFTGYLKLSSFLPLILLVIGLSACGPGGRGNEADANALPEIKADIQRVVVIHIDTTRMDDFGCYGGIPHTPNIDGVAARGMRYTNSIAPLPKTSPSVASFLTARLANRHGVYDVGGKLSEEFVTLPEILKDEGFATGGFVSNPLVTDLSGGESAGYAQGFDVYEVVHTEAQATEDKEKNEVIVTDCVDLTKRALDFVESNKDGKFLLWVFYYDPHAPYTPPEEMAKPYLENPELLKKSVELTKDQIHHQAYVSHRTKSHEYIARHYAEVENTDKYIGKLLERLNELEGQTLLVITADHGESLGDANYWFGHGKNIRWPCVNVPLIVACDGVVPKGVNDALVANVDIAPTILDIAGYPDDSMNGDGKSLVATFNQADPWPDRIVPLQSYQGNKWKGARSAEFSYQFFMDWDKHKASDWLYSLATDPTEQKDVSGEFPKVLEDHRDFTEYWFSPDRKAEKERSLRDHKEMMDRIKSLGYM